ncbi:glycosyltransferase family 2 protein [Atribacter laminatus]|jgi:glycosyltransferase involved in cell wall biosynthesis|uniref:4,4'-diaponeurosporenoate glycosyltransferase n=1 Tax=Atribacter laminatus TaxID=2847778 RepID=A0A7T1F491_ATRLM|nr:glycosyltransferase family 2 protein [Atribacter laminatus]QPM69280.1 4,4'-diaponeurosporenoate glycosyltransferase [Atribacter laminatus]
MKDQTEMNQLNNKNHRITSIIAAYNEEKTIGPIIDVLKRVPVIEQIVVVSDGSTDRTVDIARSRNVEVVDLISNVGKGGALYRGLEYIRTDVVLLLDADLVGLEESHVLSLVHPVTEREADVTIGVFEEGRFATDFAQKIAPLLSGQRAIRTDVIQNISDLEVSRYGVEVAMNRYIRKNGVTMKLVKLPGLTHVMKEEKMGLMKGFRHRVKMYWEILKNSYGGGG